MHSDGLGGSDYVIKIDISLGHSSWNSSLDM